MSLVDDAFAARTDNAGFRDCGAETSPHPCENVRKARQAIPARLVVRESEKQRIGWPG
jgi:hypothetical protein